MATCKSDDSGELVLGYFYSIEGNLPNFLSKADLLHDWVIGSASDDDDSGLSLSYCDLTSIEQYDCRRNPQHVTGEDTKEVKISCTSGELLPIAPSMDYLFISDDLNKQLQASGLKGIQTKRAEILNLDDLELENQDDLIIHVMTFPGRSVIRNDIIEPVSANKCPYCGHAPLLCPECGELDWYCPKCDKECVMIKSLHEGKQDLRISLYPGPDAGYVIDASKWDGNDFCGGAKVVTRRALDFLQKIHAGPFIAQNLRTYVGGLNKEQRERLEEAKKPVK